MENRAIFSIPIPTQVSDATNAFDKSSFCMLKTLSLVLPQCLVIDYILKLLL